MFEPEKARKKLLKAESFAEAKVKRYALYPFDHRWCFYSAASPSRKESSDRARKILDRKICSKVRRVSPGNVV